MEWTVDLGTQFCERCGRDRDTVASARGTYRDCPSCGAACCADCWNLADGACLKCTPFRLTDPPTARRVVVPPAAVAAPVTAGGPTGARPGAGTTVDPYRDLREGSHPDQPVVERRPAWQQPARRPAARPDLDAPVAAPQPGSNLVAAQPVAATRTVAAATPTAKSRPRRRAGRIGLAAVAAWVVVGTIAVVGPNADDLVTLLGNYNGTPVAPVNSEKSPYEISTGTRTSG